MKIVRTYPTLNPETLRGRNRIEDEYSRHYMNDYDNQGLITLKDNLVVLEWDMAVDPEELELFCAMAEENPDEIIVAPYKIPVDTAPNTAETVDQGFVYVHRIVTNDATLSFRWVRPGDWQCDLFGFGMIYLPHELMKEFVADPSSSPHDLRMTDTNFSIWFYRKYRQKVNIAWQVRPIHLHYACPKIYPWKKELEQVSGA